jgi:CheY-like chemotaxis protein
MPRKNGMDCLDEIRNDEGLKDIAVVIYSTSASDEDIEETFVRGANVYIRKPNNFNELKKILEKVITINWQYHTSGLNKENFLLSF